MKLSVLITVAIFNIIALQKCIAGCIKVSMNRVRMIKTLGVSGYTEDWEIYNNFRITLESNFASTGWSSCSYEYSNTLTSTDSGNNNECKPPANTYSADGFYNCYMAFPDIYLSEAEFENGIKVDVNGQIGDFDDGLFDNGPIWQYQYGFNTDPNYPMYTADDVKNSAAGYIEFYGTRNGPDARRARHFFKATYHSGSQCSFDINNFLGCTSSSSGIVGGGFNDYQWNYQWNKDEYITFGTLLGFIIAAISMCCIVFTVKICILPKYKNYSYSKVDRFSDVNV